jgi:stage II sporulation protein AA (anti-sigma F factor antagonist)
MSDLTVAISDGPDPSIKVVALTGEMDETSIDGLKTQLDPMLADLNIKILLFDFTNLEFINSKGIGYLVSVHTHLSKDQREMRIAAANEAVMDVISLVGLTTIIKYFNTVQEALQ